MKRTFKDYLLLVLKGVAMGAADVIPGVSGGTIAFIVGIYEELITSIKSINWKTLKLLFTFKISNFWKAINGNFLLSILAGIAISLLSLAKLMTYLLHTHPILIWSFFFGLILVSTYYVSKQIKKWTIPKVVWFLAGAVVAFFITGATPTATLADPPLPFIFLCGAIGICAMILPGISGSFILLLLGEYLYMMNALTTFNFPVIITFVAGALVGIILFSNVLSWLLKNFYDITIALLAGFMLGSLNKVWPWKETLEIFTDNHGVVQPLVEKNVWPFAYSGDAQLPMAIILCVVGIALVLLIELAAKKFSKTTV